MGETTGISWTDHTFNPWWGCKKVSDGCDNCYAENLATKRMGLPIWGPVRTTTRKVWPHDSKHWKEPLKWQKQAKAESRRHRVFSASMADLFEKHPILVPERIRLFDLIEETPDLDWQLLTKRPENIMKMVPLKWRSGFPENIWMGTSIEGDAVKSRIEWLADVPARIRWLSIEPLIAPLRLGPLLVPIDWVVVGGESGPGFRPMDLQWARDLLAECRRLGVPYFFKQVGGLRPKSNGDLLDGIEYKEFPV